MDSREEQELRKLIRRELKNRESLRGTGGELSPGGTVLNEERRRIIEEEIRKFYLGKGGYKPYENENGDVEWLTESEAKERDRQIPVDMEELGEGQRRVRLRILMMTILAFVVVVLLIFAMRDRYGSIQIISNVPGATILLDGSPTEFLTDFKITKLPPGTHLIAIHKTGYVPDGPVSMRVNLTAGEHEVVALQLKPQSPTEPRGQ
jgi:hypothetical protein